MIIILFYFEIDCKNKCTFKFSNSLQPPGALASLRRAETRRIVFVVTKHKPLIYKNKPYFPPPILTAKDFFLLQRNKIFTNLAQ
jgi:hypothetical protein